MTTREEATRDQVCMTPGPCDDCGEHFRSYMVQDSTWRATGLPDFGALICMPCAEIRLGRPLSAIDIPDCPANDWFTCTP